MAVGAMWRAQHTVVVGDPLQLEPVVSLPWAAQQALRRDYGIAEEGVPGRTSVQQLADRGNRFGTALPAELPNDSTEVWVGAPLRVHRRCDDPMFTISNAIAYDGLMVNGAPDRVPFVYPPASSWVDVVSSRAEGNWIPEEGRALRQILERLAATDSSDPAKHVHVISPFRAVVAGARQVVQSGELCCAEADQADTHAVRHEQEPRACTPCELRFDLSPPSIRSSRRCSGTA